MRSLTASETTALGARVLAFRNLVWITAKNRSTAALISYGFWNGDQTLNLSVVDAYTKLAVVRTFAGAGALLSVDDLELTTDLSVREARVRLSPIDTAIRQATFTYDLRLAPVQIYRALLNTTNGQFVSAAKTRFVGFVDSAKGSDPAEGGAGYIELRCVSQLREMQRSNPEVGSNESQKRRNATDNFFADVRVVGNWSIPWGQKAEKLGNDKKGSKKGKGKKNK